MHRWEEFDKGNSLSLSLLFHLEGFPEVNIWTLLLLSFFNTFSRFDIFPFFKGVGEEYFPSKGGEEKKRNWDLWCWHKNGFRTSSNVDLTLKSLLKTFVRFFTAWKLVFLSLQFLINSVSLFLLWKEWIFFFFETNFFLCNIPCSTYLMKKDVNFLSFNCRLSLLGYFPSGKVFLLISLLSVCRQMDPATKI